MQLLRCLIVSTALSGLSASAGESEALAASANIQAAHLPFGTVLDPMFASATSDQIIGYTRCGDSATWTGHYLAAEAFRYKVTQSAAALDNVSKAIAGIKSLTDVTGNNLLARCAVRMDSPFAAGIESEEMHNGIYINAAAGLAWVGNTSRDQYSGALFGLAVAYDMVDDPAIKSSVSQLVTRLVDYVKGHNWNIVMPDGSISTTFLIRPDQILTFLQIGRHVNSGHYSTDYDVQRVLLAGEVIAPIGAEVASDDSYFKFNLDYINLYNLIRLESSSAKTVFQKAYDILRAHTAGHQNAFFNMIDRGLNGANAARDAEAQALLGAWLQRPHRDSGVDLHGTVPVCGDLACTPVPIALRPTTDFLWQRSPFQLVSAGGGTIETAGIDYILPYWMTRFYGTAQSLTVQSSAASGPAIAPDSLASIYGPNGATQTQQASAQPLPTSLGGVAVTVRDAAGVDRGAALVYVSPGQINCVVPGGTAPGVATFTIASGASAPVVATGTVQAVAPTLFSMNGTGMGVAAATAIRTQAGNPSLQSPVTVFQASGSGYVSVPIDLGVDTPVFLTLYGTGIRNRSALSAVSATINGVAVPVLYAGAQPSFTGLDQVNVPLPLNLHGAGDANIVLTVDGNVANTVTINVK